MKYVSFILLIMISGPASAGSIGKYQQERLDVPITIAPMGQSIQRPAIVHPVPFEKSRVREVKRTFYSTFSQRVQQSTAEDKNMVRKI